MLLEEEIGRAEADVLCLHECDHYEDWARPWLESKGYTCHYLVKAGSPCLRTTDGRLQDGSALCIRRERCVPPIDGGRHADPPSPAGSP